VRDYLLAVNTEEAEAQREKFRRVQGDTTAALEAYAQAVAPEQSSAFEDLRSEILTYWHLLTFIFDTNNEDIRKRDASRTVYNKLALRRTSMLALTDRISAVNDRELTAGDEKVAETFERFRLRQTAIFVISIAGAFALAAITFIYVIKLEREGSARYKEIVRAQSELKELSARLVAAQEEERRAISRELHDQVGQLLTALLMEAGAAASSTGPESVELKPRLDSIKELAESSLSSLRNMALLLRPSMLDDLGLVPALRWQAREVSKRTGLKVRMNAEGVPDDLPDEHNTCIFRVVQEALNNCARHSKANTVRVQVQGTGCSISVSVQDDGTGFDAKQVRGLGLIGMEERIAHVGGSFEIDSEPGRGTELRVELPVAASQRAREGLSTMVKTA
jgi:signal transduction histidine kinase